MKCVLDSNVLIYLLNRSYSDAAKKVVDEALASDSLVPSVVTIEVLGWHRHNEETLTESRAVLALTDEIKLDDKIRDAAIGIRQQRRIKTPDAIIAATAIAKSLPQMTRNVADFSGIAGLALANPFDDPEKTEQVADESD